MVSGDSPENCAFSAKENLEKTGQVVNEASFELITKMAMSMPKYSKDLVMFKILASTLS